MKLWGGRFSGKMDPAAWTLNASIGFDQRLARQDIEGSRAWAEALVQAKVLTEDEGRRISSGLQAVGEELETGQFRFIASDEDIHTAIERRLSELIGPDGGKLHTGRSRNDQVATDLRLWLMQNLPRVDRVFAMLQSALLEKAEAGVEILLPGYTHLQPAQVISLGHWWLSHFWGLQRDRSRLADLRPRLASLPLGSSALAGTPYPVDRRQLALNLGFDDPSPNSLDAVSDRDFVAEFLFITALAGVHLSRLAEGVALFSTAEFGFFELSDAYATGSSLMPQKKNPDVFELARGKSGTLLGRLTGLLATLKALPSAYDKDLQEDKIPLFEAFDTLAALLPVLAGAVRTLTVRPDRMRAAIDPGLMATDLADYLVSRGLPFRQAHALVGLAVVFARAQDKPLDALSLDELRSLDPKIAPALFDANLYTVFDPVYSVARRTAIGGAAPSAVREQIALAKKAI